MAADWRTIAANRPFLLFAAAMSGSYVLAFQVYLALPLRARELFGAQAGMVIGGVFAVSALAAVTGQLRLTAWAKQRMDGPRAIICGLLVMGVAFLPLLPGPYADAQGFAAIAAGAGALAGCVALLAWGLALLYPFEMDTIVRLSGERLVATHYGAYNTAYGIALGNLAAGALFDAAQHTGTPLLPWAALAATALLCATTLTRLHRRGHLTRHPELAVVEGGMA